MIVWKDKYKLNKKLLTLVTQKINPYKLNWICYCNKLKRKKHKKDKFVPTSNAKNNALLKWSELVKKWSNSVKMRLLTPARTMKLASSRPMTSKTKSVTNNTSYKHKLNFSNNVTLYYISILLKSKDNKSLWKGNDRNLSCIRALLIGHLSLLLKELKKMRKNKCLFKN